MPVSAVFPVCERIEDAALTIAAIQSCDPRPEEVIVLVDGGSRAVMDAIATRHPEVRLMSSTERLGPGGARNRLVAEARHELVANFDDDSRPETPDYFARVVRDAGLFPDAAVISAASMQSEKEIPGFMRIAIFSGCGCVFRKSWFQKTSGFVPLRVAYCMEEVDLSLRLHHLGGAIIHDPGLHVRHFRERDPNPSAELNAQVLANTALMPFLRYPLMLFPLGVWHVLSRILSLIRNGWLAGLGAGLLLIPGHLGRHRAIRDPLPAGSIFSWMRLRRHPELLRSDPALDRN